MQLTKGFNYRAMKHVFAVSALTILASSNIAQAEPRTSEGETASVTLMEDGGCVIQKKQGDYRVVTPARYSGSPLKWRCCNHGQCK